MESCLSHFLEQRASLIRCDIKTDADFAKTPLEQNVLTGGDEHQTPQKVFHYNLNTTKQHVPVTQSGLAHNYAQLSLKIF